MLNFWASWCEPCQVEAPLLERAQPALAAHDGTVLGVTYKDASPDSAELRARVPPHLPEPARQRPATSPHSYGTDQLPESFIIDRQGRIVAISRGEIEQEFINRAARAGAAARERAAASPRPLARASALLVVRASASAVATRRTAPRASLPTIERQVMCVTCKIPLNVAESPQADREREFIQELIDEGQDEAQIKRALVGPVRPDRARRCRRPRLRPDRLSRAAAVVLGARRAAARAAAALAPHGARRRAARRRRAPPLSPADAARLDSDLARFD